MLEGTQTTTDWLTDALIQPQQNNAPPKNATHHNSCAATGQPLELPAVHFLCGHSFNGRSLGDADLRECPLCAPEHRRVLEIRAGMRAGARWLVVVQSGEKLG